MDTFLMKGCNMAGQSFRDLDVWKKSLDLAVDVYKHVKFLPKEELYCLSDQMRRAAISIPSNISEGQQRYSNRDFKHFLLIAKGSLGELETQIMICERLEYLTREQSQNLYNQCSEIGKMLNGLINHIQ